MNTLHPGRCCYQGLHYTYNWTWLAWIQSFHPSMDTKDYYLIHQVILQYQWRWGQGCCGTTWSLSRGTSAVCFYTSRATLALISAADTNLLPLIFNLNECLYYVTVHNLVFKCKRVYFTTVDNKVISMCHVQNALQFSEMTSQLLKNPQSNPFETV